MPQITSPHKVELNDDEQEHLFALIHKSVNSARVITRARILTKLAKGHSGRTPDFKKANLLPWQKQQWCIAKVDEEFVACMEDVIELYALPLDEKSPVVCFDESPFQLLREVREPIPGSAGRHRREDCEYERCGVAEVMMVCQPAAGLRKCLVMAHRKKADFAAVCKELDRMFPKAQKITLVCDNLNTHTKGVLFTTFLPEEARRLTKKIEIRHTPKHGSWLNIAELEFAVLGRTVFKKRIADKE